MANNYLQPVENHFDLANSSRLDDVEDDIFLKGSRNFASSSNSITAAASQAASAARKQQGGNPFEEDEGDAGKPNNPFEDPHMQSYAQKRREIEQRSLESTQKSLGMLYQTEEVGIATAVELAKQREQLEKTANRLDEINSNLRFSQRHLNGIKSVFGGLKNYFSGSRTNSLESSKVTSPTSDEAASSIDGGAAAAAPMDNATSSSSTTRGSGYLSPSERYDSHPISRIRDERTQQQQQRPPQDAFQSQLDANLEEMCGNLSRLKGLACELGTEIESQNSMLDDMNYKIDDVDLKVTKQNKEIKKLLGNK